MKKYKKIQILIALSIKHKTKTDQNIFKKYSHNQHIVLKEMLPRL